MFKIADYKKKNKFYPQNRDYYFIDQLSIFYLIKFILRKIIRRCLPKKNKFPLEIATVYQNIKIYHRRDLHGEGMTVGTDYIRLITSLNLKNIKNVFEFCSGPGYIGYNLLANQFCEKLILADINPNSIECANLTKKNNNLEDKVEIYLSDVMDNVKTKYKFDLVVGNPVHFDETYNKNEWRYHTNRNLIASDNEWKIHKKFYEQIPKYMNKNGYIIMQENSSGSEENIFKEMIIKNGGEYIGKSDGISINGIGNGMHYIISKWN